MAGRTRSSSAVLSSGYGLSTFTLFRVVPWLASCPWLSAAFDFFPNIFIVREPYAAFTLKVCQGKPGFIASLRFILCQNWTSFSFLLFRASLLGLSTLHYSMGINFCQEALTICSKFLQKVEPCGCTRQGSGVSNIVSSVHTFMHLSGKKARKAIEESYAIKERRGEVTSLAQLTQQAARNASRFRLQSRGVGFPSGHSRQRLLRGSEGRL